LKKIRIRKEEKSNKEISVKLKKIIILLTVFILTIMSLANAHGDNGAMEISVAMGTDGLVKNVDIWEHSENALVAKEDFLKQFLGKTVKILLSSTKTIN
jgi:hypothetical protein